MIAQFPLWQIRIIGQGSCSSVDSQTNALSELSNHHLHSPSKSNLFHLTITPWPKGQLEFLAMTLYVIGNPVEA